MTEVPDIYDFIKSFGSGLTEDGWPRSKRCLSFWHGALMAPPAQLAPVDPNVSTPIELSSHIRTQVTQAHINIDHPRPSRDSFR